MLCAQWNGLKYPSPVWVEARMSCDVRLTTSVAAALKLHLLVCNKISLLWHAFQDKQKTNDKNNKIKINERSI